jgi:hypothetical protein
MPTPHTYLVSTFTWKELLIGDVEFLATEGANVFVLQTGRDVLVILASFKMRLKTSSMINGTCLERDFASRTKFQVAR